MFNLSLATVARGYTANGLNQFSASGGVSLGYDARGNLTSSGSDTYGYSSENLLVSGPGGAAVSYDPLLRITRTVSASGYKTRFAFDGQDLIGEYDGSLNLRTRYVFGPGEDEPLVEYDASGTKTYLAADERGSVIARSNASGAVTGVNTYDEYGIPGSGNAGRFGYTGQAWVPELGMQYSKARIYSPTLASMTGRISWLACCAGEGPPASMVPLVGSPSSTSRSKDPVAAGHRKLGARCARQDEAANDAADRYLQRASAVSRRHPQ